MRIIDAVGREDIATVYVAQVGEGKLVEFAESCQPSIPRDKKWVLIISVLSGCPVRCLMCDAGDSFKGALSREEIFAQIDYLVGKRFPDGDVAVEKFKIQFARMGEPALNPAVIDVLEEMQDRYRVPGFLPSISTVAPVGTDAFFERLIDVKRRLYSRGRFQLQFSIHTTDQALRDRIIPIRKWDFPRIARYVDRFYQSGDQKVSLNFALARGMPVDSHALLKHFSPEKFLVKITPINPTHRAQENNLCSYVDADAERRDYQLVDDLRAAGYRVILNIGEVEENRIGSNCGQYVMRHLRSPVPVGENEQRGYEYWRARP